MIDINNLPQRIKSIYDFSTDQEKYYLRKILSELSINGISETYEKIWLSDYTEIPVSIEVFTSHNTFLGKSNRQGSAIYPFWKKTMSEIFKDPAKFDEVIFTGATRIGKSTTAVTCAIYMLYRLMCLRDPQEYFQKKDVSKFSLLFFNVTKDLARGVAYREFNDTLKTSPWFNDRGTFSKSEQNFYYIPDGGKIVIDYGSDASHALGQQVFCVTGDTKIYTTVGFVDIAHLEDQMVQLYQYDWYKDSLAIGSAMIVKTGEVNNTVSIFVNDIESLECTDNHRILLRNGEYKAAVDLIPGDMLASVDGMLQIVTDPVSFNHYVDPIPVYDVIDVRPHHNFICSNGSIAIVAHNCAIMDEINFARSGVKDVNKAKERMLDTYNTISARIKGTFRQDGHVLGKLFAVSSKKSDSDFLEDHIQRQKDSGAAENMYIADAPQWEVLPASNYSPGRFFIAVGSRHQKGYVVPDNQSDLDSLEDIKKQGFKLMAVPVNHKPEFLADFEIALRDIAGISVPGTLSFITQEMITRCINFDRRNPFYNDILSIGTKDSFTIEEFFHLECVDNGIKSKPIFIHLDLSINDDKTGIGGVFANGRTTVKGADGKSISQLKIGHLFSVSIQAPSGDKIPYAKITEFICWLRRTGFNIEGISADSFQSEYMIQLLEAQGFDVTKLSVDRTPSGYMAVRDALLDERLELLDVQILQDELIHIQRDAFSGKLDHPAGGCFTIDTPIAIVNEDTCMTIGDLLENDAYKNYQVFTINESTNLVEHKHIRKVFATKIVEELMVVELDNGRIIHCTSDHRFLTEDERFVEIQDIEIGTPLMSMCFIPYKLKNKYTIKKMCVVYDLEIEDNHNFALGAGVYVHNSKDSSDCIAGSVWNCTLKNPDPTPTKSAVSAAAAVNGPRVARGSGNRAIPNSLLGPSVYNRNNRNNRRR